MEMEIREINEIFNSGTLGLFWKGNDYYPEDKIDDKAKQVLKQLCCIEVVFSRGMQINDSSKNLFDFYNQFLYDYFSNKQDEFLLIKSEHKKQIKNRIRSYKGIIPKEYRNESYVKEEISFDDDYTIILSLINPLGEHLKELLYFFTDRNTCCILTMNSLKVRGRESEILSTFSEKYMVHESISRIRYRDLIIDYCQQGDIIYRIGGDGGQNEVSLQIFCLKNLKQKVIKETKPYVLKKH